jgi:hypothetical protein
MLTKKYVRDGHNRIVGSVTTGYTGSYETVVRDADNAVIGTTSERFGTTRDGRGGLVSNNTADPGLLINPKK